MTGYIDNRWLIDALEDTTINNKRPVLRFAPTAPRHLGPRPLTTTGASGQCGWTNGTAKTP